MEKRSNIKAFGGIKSNIIKRHAEKFLLSISFALTTQGGDPEQKHFRMTPLFDNGLTGHGFTLIELLVVVLIIGLLAAVALPQYNKAVFKSRITELIVTVKELQKATDLYILENGYPEVSSGSTRRLWDDRTNLLGIDIPYPDTTLIGSVQVYCSAFSCVIEIWGSSSKIGDGEISMGRLKGSSQWGFSGGGADKFGSLLVPALKQAVVVD